MSENEPNRCGWCGKYLEGNNTMCAHQGPPCNPHMQDIHEKEMEEQARQQEEIDFYRRHPNG